MIRRLFLILLTVSSLSGFAQPSSIGMDSSSTAPGTVVFNQGIGFDVYLKNTGGGASITDTVTVFMAVDSFGAGQGWQLPYDTTIVSVSGLNTFSLQTVTINNTITSANYKPGVNPVVIWPKANSSPTSDSLFITIFVDTMAGVENKNLFKGFIMYPNPAKDFLFFNSLAPDHPYKKIKFYDLDGRLVLETNFAPKIDVGAFKNGLYTVVVETLDGEQKKLKFLKE